MRILIAILALVGIANAAAITFTAADSTVNTWWSNVLNWSGGVAPGATDTCIFDVTGGSKTPNTATQGLTNPFASIRITSAYTRTWSWNGTRGFQLSNDFIDDGITGTHYLGTVVTMNGATSTYHVGSGCAAGYSASATVLTFNGTAGCVLDQDLGAMYYGRLNLGSSALVTNSGASAFSITCAASDTSIKLESNAVLTNAAGLTLYLPGAGSYLWYQASGASIIGAGGISVLVGTTPYTMPTANLGPNSTSLIAYGSTTINQTGNLTVANAATRVFSFQTNTSGVTLRWINASSNVTCNILQLGSTHASAAVVGSYGSGTYSINAFDGTTRNSGANIDSFQTLVGYCSGSFSMGTSHAYIPGTSSWTMDSAGILLTNSKDLYDFFFNPGVGLTDSVVDSAGSYHNVSVLSGKLKPLTAGFNLTGNLLLSGTDTLFGNRANAKWIRLANVATVRITNTNAQRLLDSLKFNFVNGGSFLKDSANDRVKRVLLSSGAGGKKLAFQSGTSLQIVGYVPGDFSGISGALDSTISTNPGQLAMIATTVPQCDSFRYIRDQEAQGYPGLCTTGCVDGGGTVNWAFDRPLVNYTIPASLPPTGGRVIIQGAHLRSSGGSVTVDGVPAALTAQHDAWVSFTAPAHAVGTVWIIYDHGTGVDSVQITYATNSLTDSTIIGVLLGQSNAQGAAVLHASRDTAKTDSALGYRRTSIQNLEGTWMRCTDPMVGSNASMGPSLSTSLVRYLRKPVALINAARITSNLVGYYWHKAISWGMRNPDNPWDSTFMYGKEISFIENGLQGRKPVFFEWYQGETECQYIKDSILVYPTRFDTLQARMKLDLGLDSMPTLIVQVSIDSQTANIPYDTNYTHLRNMQYGLDRGTNEAIFAAPTYDLAVQSQFHLSYKGQDSLGPRLAAAYVRYRNGIRSPYPHLTAVTTSGDTLVLQFNSPLYPSVTNVSGFSLDSAGTSATITSARTDVMQLKLLTSRTEASLNTRYMIGRLPDVTYPVLTHARLPVLPIGTKRAVGWVDRSGRLVTNLRKDWLKPGDTLNITGTGFGASQGIGTIKCNSTSLGTAITWTNTSVAIPIPIISRGYYDLIVTTAAGVSDTVAYGLKIFRPEAH
jgi:hypothetical protein